MIGFNGGCPYAVSGQGDGGDERFGAGKPGVSMGAAPRKRELRACRGSGDREGLILSRPEESFGEMTDRAGAAEFPQAGRPGAPAGWQGLEAPAIARPGAGPGGPSAELRVGDPRRRRAAAHEYDELRL